MRILSIGAGALGAYICGSLAYAGAKVTFLEQPLIADLLTENGLILNIDQRKIKIYPVSIAYSFEQAMLMDDYDVAILAVKSFDTQNIIEKIKTYADDFPPILCLQNGVENETIIASVLGDEKVIAGTVTSAIGKKNTGEIILEKKRGIGIFAKHPLSHDLNLLFNKAGLNAHLYINQRAMKWSKMLTNLLANASSAILDYTPDEIFSDPRLCYLEICQIQETLSTMRAYGIKPINLPKAPVISLAFICQYLPLYFAQILLQKSIGKGRGEKMPSFHIDLYSGRKISEVDYLNGAVVRFGQKMGIPTPVNALLNQSLLNLTSGKININYFRRQPEKLLELL